jgi:hypothetical protein
MEVPYGHYLLSAEESTTVCFDDEVCGIAHA